MAMAYPEAVCVREQMRAALTGKEIADVEVFDVTTVKGGWRFGSITQPPDVFRSQLLGGTVGEAQSLASSVFLPASTGNALALGYLSGTVLHHPPGATLPERRCLSLRFTDDTSLSVTISTWGLIRVLGENERAAYVTRWYGRGIEPNSEQYTWEGFRDAVAQVRDPKLSVRKFLVDFGPGYYVSGIDSGYALEILYLAEIHPKRRLASLDPIELKTCYRAVNAVMQNAMAQGGRTSERNLYGQWGSYAPCVCKDTLGQECPECGETITKFAFEGASCYVCPGCQPLAPRA